MLKFLKFFASGSLMLFEYLRGTNTVTEIKRPENALGDLRGFTVRGFEIAIYCHRREYHVRYSRWYVPNRTLYSYNVFSVVGHDAPEPLRKACELDVDIPSLVHRWNFDSMIRIRQVNAYLDLLETRIVAAVGDGILQ
jgi:hypothetical protein